MSSHWPTYDEWFATLNEADKARARALTERFRSVGAREPESWARSEVSENIAQLARFMVLRTLKNHALEYWLMTGALDETAKTDPVFDRFLTHLRGSGFRDSEIGRFAQKIAAITAWQLVHILDEGCDPDAAEDLPKWSLEECDAAGELTGRNIGGLHESLYEFDPTQKQVSDDI